MASRFWVGGTGTWDNSTTTHWSASTGGGGGSSVPGSGDTVTFDGASGGGTVTPNYNMTVTSVTMGAFTGILDFSVNNNNPTMTNFSNTGTGTRTLNMGNGTWNVTGNAMNVWNMATITGLTLNANSSTINFSYSGSTGTRICNLGGATISYNNVSWSAGNDIISLSQSIVMTGTATVAGTSGSNKVAIMSSAAGTLRSITFGNFSFSNVSSWTDISLVFNGAGNTWTLSEDLNLASASAFPTLNITAGTFTTNNFNPTMGLFVSTGSATRVLNMGSSTFTITGNAVAAWNASNTGITINAGTSTIKFTDSTSNTVGINGGGTTNTYATVWFSRGASTGNNQVGQSSVFGTFKDDGSAAHSIIITAATTLSFTTFTVSGTSGNVITLNSSTTGSYTLQKVASTSVVSCDYLNIQHCIARGGLFYAGANSVNNQGVATAGSGWVFTTPNVTNSGFLMLM